VFPAERGKVLEKALVDALVSVAEVVCGPFEVDGVPEHDGGGAVRSVRSATDRISSLLSCREDEEPCLLWLRETLM
jgi:hypothetical protein